MGLTFLNCKVETITVFNRDAVGIEIVQEKCFVYGKGLIIPTRYREDKNKALIIGK